MGMPITVCIQDRDAGDQDVLAVASWFAEVDQRFSPYLETSEVCRLNAGAIGRKDVSRQLEDVLLLCEQTKVETGGYFDIERHGRIDPSGLVKGWAIEQASALLSARGLANHFVEAGGDVQAVGLNSEGQPWRVGIRNPFKRDEVVKVLAISDQGMATSGTAIRGAAYLQPVAAKSPVDRGSERDCGRAIDLRRGSPGHSRVRHGARRTRVHRRATECRGVCDYR